MLKIKTDEEWLAELQPDFAALILRLMKAVKQRGYDIKIIQGLRTFAQQNALYAKGRTAPGAKVTNAKGGESPHNYGLAVDFCLRVPADGSYYPDPHPVWDVIGEEAQKLGLEWGGSWESFKDRPHVQAPIALAEMKRLYDLGGRDQIWKYVARLCESNKELIVRNEEIS